MPFFTPSEFQEHYNITRRDLAEMILDEGLPVQHTAETGLLIDEDEASSWLEDQGYLEDSADEDECDDEDE